MLLKFSFLYFYPQNILEYTVQKRSLIGKYIRIT